MASSAFGHSIKAIWLDAAHNILLPVAGTKYIICAASSRKTSLRLMQHKVYNVLMETGRHDFGQHFACHREKGDATAVATF